MKKKEKNTNFIIFNKFNPKIGRLLKIKKNL